MQDEGNDDSIFVQEISFDPMKMQKQRYNAKGRNLEVKSKKDDNFELQTKMTPTELQDAVEGHVQKMSKSKRKRYEKFIEKKNKKLRRTELLQELEKSSVVDPEFKKTFYHDKVKKVKSEIVDIKEETIDDFENITVDRPLKNDMQLIEEIRSKSKFEMPSTKRETDPSCQLGQANNLNFKPTRNFKVPIRSEDIEEIRSKLPIIEYEHQIMEHLMEQDVVVVCGATGSGKTTQIGQFCWEYGFGDFGRICITQPRKVAAISVANRVQDELQNCKVGFKVRHESNVDPSTEMVFMTDGILLKEMMSDLLLSNYSVICIDEAHERNINTDILIGLLSRVVKLRRETFVEGKEKPLKLIIMSATMRVNDFTENSKLFSKPPPVVDVPAKIHPVILHYNRITPNDYISAIFTKTCEIHEKYPPGGILLFVTGQKEVELLIDRLNAKLSDECIREHAKVIDDELADIEDLDFLGYEEDHEDITDDEEPVEIVGSLDTETEKQLLARGNYGGKVKILPLYSMLSSEAQAAVFEKVPQDTRLIVVATNIAETSITIPNIKYVVDSGKVKEKSYNHSSNVYQYKVSWTSKASCDQRLGRCGRTSPGHCFRIFSSTVFQHQFVEYSIPEILKMPIENVLLHLKAIGIDKAENFPFPTIPSHSSISKGLHLLRTLNALDSKNQITSDGLIMSKFPVNARFARILISCLHHHSLRYAITIVSILSSQQLCNSHSKIMQLEKNRSELIGKLFVVCAKDFDESLKLDVNQKSLKEIRLIRNQISIMLNKILSNGFEYDTKMKPPSSEDLLVLKKAILSGFVDQVCVNSKLLENKHNMHLSNIYDKQGLKLNNLRSMVQINELCTYAEVVNNGNHFSASDATILPLAWLGPTTLHLAKSIELVSEPLPKFDVKSDSLTGYVSISYDNTTYRPPIFQANLLNHYATCKESKINYQKYLLYLLLNGEIAKEPFLTLKKYLKTSPNTIISKNSVYVSKSVALITRLRQKDVYKIRQLCEIWKTEKMFLLSEILPFYHESSYQYLRALWPPFQFDGKIQITSRQRDILNKIKG
eukprot:NODE_370_length_8652_cov_0.611715.p1 type:complete len:1056 gc:universal NODE_370_length_8652_cov_0.611715:8242-5075(-)